MTWRPALSICLFLLGAARAPVISQVPVAIGDEIQANTYTTGEQRVPAVAVDGSGSFVVLWESTGQDGSGESVQGQRFDSLGTPHGIEFQVNAFTTDDQRDPTAAYDADGNSLVLWTSWAQDGDANSVQGRLYDADGLEIGNEFQINSYTSENQAQADITFANGEFVTVWASYRQDGFGWGVQGQRLDLQGAPVGNEFPVNSFTTSNQNYPSVASDAAGDFIVVWQSRNQDGSDYSIQGQLFDSNGSLSGNEFQINTYTTGNQRWPDVARSADGQFFVSWQSADQDGYGIFGQLFDSQGAPVGTELSINTHTTSVQTRSAVAATDSGDFMVTWGSLGQDYSGYAVEGRRIDAAGTPIGGEFQINSHTAGHQYRPAIAAAPRDDFVVAWRANRDGSYSSVDTQRFATPIFSDGFESGDTMAWSSTIP
jgi:hypothetical protein